jgi:hypothetical protein
MAGFRLICGKRYRSVSRARVLSRRLIVLFPGDDEAVYMPCPTVVRGGGERHRRVCLEVVLVVAGRLLMNPAEQFLARRLNMHQPLAAGRHAAWAAGLQNRGSWSAHIPRCISIDRVGRSGREESAEAAIGRGALRPRRPSVRGGAASAR